MSVERIRRRSLLTVAACKVVGELAWGVGSVVKTVGDSIDRAVDGIFLIEADAAKRYQDLTGINLGELMGYPDRYDGERAEIVSGRDDELEDDDE